MIIDAIGSYTPEGSPPDTEPKKELGRNEFLTLLVAQLKHQDPLNPLEGTEFTAQLAQFSSLEQLFNVNDTLIDIQGRLGLQENGNVLDYIGKMVKTNDNTIFVKEGKMDSGAYTLEDRADVTISVYNELGLEVRTFYEGWKDAGEHALNWDGRDHSGNMVGDGTYTFEVKAINENGFPVPHNAYLTGEVTGVTYQGGIPYLMIGNQWVTPENIIEVTKTANQ